MRRVFKSSSVVFAAVGLVLAGSVLAMAQSGSRNYPPSGSSRGAAPRAGSGQRAHQQAPLALEGYCPVSIVAMKKWVKGDPAYQVAYDGRSYLFANERGKRMFQADPAKYVPSLGGDCAVALVKMGRRVPGNIRHASFHKGFRYLFPAAEQRHAFLASREKYVTVSDKGAPTQTDSTARRPTSGSSTRTPVRSGSGSR